MEPVLAANGDLAWLLAAFGLVSLMFPGLALFYGGMLGAKNTLNIMMMVLSTLAVTAVLYVVYGYGLVSGPSVGGWGLIGDPSDFLGLGDFQADGGTGGAEGAFDAAFFILFAAITIAIVSSGAAGRMKFSGWIAFSVVWLTVVYFPVAHWIFGIDEGWMSKLGVHDYAGGTAVHMNSGVAALALAFALGKRRSGERPHSLPLVVIGGGILFFGWFGFNGGTAGAADFLAQYVVLTTLLSACTGMIGFAIVEQLREKRITGLGIVTGLIAGLVGITPAADVMSPIGALLLGLVAGAGVCLLLGLKNKLGIDESLDAFAVHGLGGIFGTLCVILFASGAAPGGVTGVLFGGDPDIVWRELVGIAATCGYSFVMTYLVAKGLDKLIGIRVDEETEAEGLDVAVHAESAYDLMPAAGRGALPGGNGAITGGAVSTPAPEPADAPSPPTDTAPEGTATQGTAPQGGASPEDDPDEVRV